MSVVAIWYEQKQIMGVRRGGQIWLRGVQIAAPLGFRDERYLRQLYERHEDEFSPDETQMMPFSTPGGTQMVRVFSLGGVRLLALLARTEPGKRFRRFLLDVLAGRVRLGVHPRHWDTDHLVGTEAREVLEYLDSIADDPDLVRTTIRGLMAGTASIPPDPAAAAFIQELRDIRSQSSLAAKQEADWRQRAVRLGYDPDALARRARGRRLPKGASALPDLTVLEAADA